MDHESLDLGVSARAAMRDPLTYGTNYNGWVECKQADSRDKNKTCDYSLLHQAVQHEQRSDPNFAKQWLSSYSAKKDTSSDLMMHSFMKYN